MKNLFKVRTITAFLTIQPNDFPPLSALEASSTITETQIGEKISKACSLLRQVEEEITQQGYSVQTIRLATNPFGEWLHDEDDFCLILERLKFLDSLLEDQEIQFCAIGPAQSMTEIQACPQLLATSPRISCSANVEAGDVKTAKAVANCILEIAHYDRGNNGMMDGLGNFRFCATPTCLEALIPFFPAAKSFSSSSMMDNDSKDGIVGFALGLENGPLVYHLLGQCQSMEHISTTFQKGMTEALLPLQEICQRVSKQLKIAYLGLDTSINPSLDENGSVAAAMELLEEIPSFGGTGTLGAAAALTQSIQSLSGIQRTGYCGLMLPVCEDQRLAQLAATDSLRVTDLLSISNVCGVGVDTVPLPGDTTQEQITSLILDMVGIPTRWKKSLSCRILPFAGKFLGDRTDFDSPYMVNTKVFGL